MQTKPALLMPDDRPAADQAVTLPKKQRKSICILDEAVVGTVPSRHRHGAPATSTVTRFWPLLTVTVDAGDRDQLRAARRAAGSVYSANPMGRGS